MIISYPNHFIVAEWTLNLIPPLDFPDKAKYYGHTANHLAVSFSHFFYNDCVYFFVAHHLVVPCDDRKVILEWSCDDLGSIKIIA